jgi:hypothetical protein
MEKPQRRREGRRGQRRGRGAEAEAAEVAPVAGGKVGGEGDYDMLRGHFVTFRFSAD